VTVGELSDRIEIQDLLVRYARAIDTKDWDLLDTCFTADAQVDYTSSGGIAGRYPEVRQWLAKALAIFPVAVHYVTNSTVELKGDRASARTYLYNPMQMRGADGTNQSFTVGGIYHDQLVRGPSGWRISERREEQIFVTGDAPVAAPRKK
jgi:3-phenylpropionate/cinnamic acid dioxygenase small subunit